MAAAGRSAAEVAEAAAGHVYLGDLEDVHSVASSTALPTNAVSEIPVLFLDSAIAFPGQTIPLRLPRSSERLPVVKDAIHRRSPLGIMCLAAVQRCFSRLDSDNVLEGMNEDDGDKRVVSSPERLLVGTTVEVVQCLRSDDLRLICRGKERFQCLQVGEQIFRFSIFKCLVTPMCTFGPRSCRLAKDAHSFAIPHWKIRQYDIRPLAGKASRAYRRISRKNTIDIAMRDPSMFSYWLSAQLTVPFWYKQILLNTLHDSDRLRHACSIMERMDDLRCFHCETVIASMTNVIDMTPTGGSSSFVNPHGYVHEILTVSQVRNTDVHGMPQREDSWFQGYEWDAATCRACDLHLGWYFHSIDPAPGDAPTEFFGLRLSSLCFESLKGKADIDMDKLHTEIEQCDSTSRLSRGILLRLNSSLEL